MSHSPEDNPSRKSIGAHGELLAAAHLRDAGWTIRETNYETKFGELDIIAERTETLGPESCKTVAFIEVKTRTNATHISPERNITRRKRRKIVNLAKVYLDQRGLDDVVARFDVVTVDLGSDRSAESPVVEHYPAAFDALGRFN